VGWIGGVWGLISKVFFALRFSVMAMVHE